MRLLKWYLLSADLNIRYIEADSLMHIDQQDYRIHSVLILI